MVEICKATGMVKEACRGIKGETIEYCYLQQQLVLENADGARLMEPLVRRSTCRFSAEVLENLRTKKLAS